MAQTTWFVSCLLAVGTGCPSADESGETNTPVTSGAAGTDATAGQATGGASTEGNTGDAVFPPAQGISVDWVEANQGVGIKIGENGDWVGPADRTAFLLANRVALVRAFWQFDDLASWRAREIEAQLTIGYADGTSEVFIDRKLVEDESFIGNLNESFFWGLMPHQAQPGITYKIELFETEPSESELGGAQPAPNVFPFDGEPDFVGIENSYQVMKIVLVPFSYNDGAGCVSTPDLSDATMQLFWDLMYMMNPLDDLQLEIHAPVEWNQPLEGFAELNAFMSGTLRVEENAPPETYYYGLIDNCSNSLDGLGGQAYGIPSDPQLPESAYQRVSSGLSLSNIDFAAETFVHEVGHSQGRYHVACNGQEGGPDPTYPIEGGAVGEWGFGVVDFALRHPTAYKDYMTYCNPTWVSTWGWNKVYPTIKALSQLDADFPGNGDGAPLDDGLDTLLIGDILPSGTEIWHTAKGRLNSTDTPAASSMDFRSKGQLISRQGAFLRQLGDGDRVQRVIPVPAGFDAVDDLTLVEGGSQRKISVEVLQSGHVIRLTQ